MKSTVTHLLLSVLVITSSIKAADAESSALTAEVTNDAFTALLDRLETKQLPSKWKQDEDGKWRNLTVTSERQLSTLVIFGSDNNMDATPLQQRSLNVYHFAEEIPLDNQSHFFEPMEDANNAERILPNKQVEKIIQFKKSRRERPIGYSKTKAPKQSPHKVFKPQGKLGYSSRLLNSLIKEKRPNNINQCASLTQKLNVELQKEVAIFNARFRNLALQEKDAARLQEQIKAFKCAYSDDFVSKLNALIDDIRLHAQDTLTPQEAINLLFKQGDEDGIFALLGSTIKTTNKDNSEHIFDFYAYCKKSGRIPVEEYAAQAPAEYASWWTSFGETDEAKKLRTINAQMMQIDKALLETDDHEKKEALDADWGKLKEKRAALVEKIKQDVFEQAKQATMAQLALYSQRMNDKEILTYREAYIAQEQEDIARAQQDIAHTLLYITAAQRAEGVPTIQAVRNIVTSQLRKDNVVVRYDDELLKQLAQEVDTMDRLIKTTDGYTEIGS